MQRSKVGSRKKGRRSAKKKPYYAAYRAKNTGKQIRARANREKRIAASKEHTEIGSPSQIKQRGIRVRKNNSDILTSIEVQQDVLDTIDS